jgi:hypothetical protein
MLAAIRPLGRATMPAPSFGHFSKALGREIKLRPGGPAGPSEREIRGWVRTEVAAEIKKLRDEDLKRLTDRVAALERRSPDQPKASST